MPTAREMANDIVADFICDRDEDQPWRPSEIVRLVEATIENCIMVEREACATVCDAMARGYGINHCEHCHDGEMATSNAAHNIRAR